MKHFFTSLALLCLATANYGSAIHLVEVVNQTNGMVHYQDTGRLAALIDTGTAAGKTKHTRETIPFNPGPGLKNYLRFRLSRMANSVPGNRNYDFALLHGSYTSDGVAHSGLLLTAPGQPHVDQIVDNEGNKVPLDGNTENIECRIIFSLGAADTINCTVEIVSSGESSAGSSSTSEEEKD